MTGHGPIKNRLSRFQSETPFSVIRDLTIEKYLLTLPTYLDGKYPLLEAI